MASLARDERSNVFWGQHKGETLGGGGILGYLKKSRRTSGAPKVSRAFHSSIKKKAGDEFETREKEEKRGPSLNEGKGGYFHQTRERGRKLPGDA